MKIHVSLSLKQMIILHRRTYHRMAATSETRSRPSYCKELPFSRTLDGSRRDHHMQVGCGALLGQTGTSRVANRPNSVPLPLQSTEYRSRPTDCKELPALEDHGETITCRLVAGRVSVKLAHGE